MLAHEADDQLALDHEADDQLALDQEAASHPGSVAAVAAQPVESNTLNPVTGSVATKRSSPAFGSARPSAAIAAGMFNVPTPSAPVEAYPVGTFAETINAPLT